MKKLSKSLRKYIRREKTRIRREVFSIKEQQKLINKFYSTQVNFTKQKAEDRK